LILSIILSGSMNFVGQQATWRPGCLWKGRTGVSAAMAGAN